MPKNRPRGVPGRRGGRDVLSRIATVLGMDKVERQRDELRKALDRSLSAMHKLLEWDQKRNFIVPYKVRDPIIAAINSAPKVPAGVYEAAEVTGDKP